MEYIQIPLADFSFTDFAKKEAQKIISTYITESTINSLARGYVQNLQVVHNAVNEKIWTFISSEDKLVFIGEILKHLLELKAKDKQIWVGVSNIGTQQARQVRDDEYYDVLSSLQYFVYKLATDIGYDFDRNTFSYDEAYNINDKVDAIIYALNKLQAGQEIIFNEFEVVREQIKIDFEALKDDKILGKKRFFKVALGTVANYAGNKAADEIFTQLRPYIVDLLAHQAPHLLQGFTKMIG